MVGTVRNSIKAQVEAKLSKPLKEVIIQLINQEGNLAEANRKLTEITGITVPYDTFYSWVLRNGIEIRMVAK